MVGQGLLSTNWTLRTHLQARKENTIRETEARRDMEVAEQWPRRWQGTHGVRVLKESKGMRLSVDSLWANGDF